MNLYAPRRGRRIDNGEKLAVDAVTFGQQLVEAHRAHHRTNIGHHQVEDRDFEGGDLIGRFCRIQDLIKDDGVHRHGGVITRDDALRGDVEHGLHHVHPSPDPVDYGHDERETRLEGANITAEALDRPFVPLGDPLNR